MTRKTESEVWKAARFLRAKLKGKEIVFLCIGTQKITGDRFGPGTGTLLNDRLSSPCYIYGMLGSNLHAQNLERAVAALRVLHPKACFVALDAALGAAEEVGTVRLHCGGVRPRLALGKPLPFVGDFSVIAVVAEQGSDPGRQLRNADANMVDQLSCFVCAAFRQALA